MERQLLAYLDNCVYSNMLKKDFKELRMSFSTFGHRIAFSDVHIQEMKSNSREYADLLEELDAVFIRNPGAEHNQYHPISSIDYGEPHRRFSEHIKFSPIYDAFEAMLSPMQHILGGRREKNMVQIADETGCRIKRSLGDLLSSVGEDDSTWMSQHFFNQIDLITEETRELDGQKDWNTIESQVERARLGDPMRGMQPIERVNYIISCLEPIHRDSFLEQFPESFAQKKVLSVGELTGFAFALFSLGLTKRKGIFSGTQQEKMFAAQYRDAMHVEEASRCDLFVTMDKGAFDLAAATFAYAGFATRSILLSPR